MNKKTLKTSLVSALLFATMQSGAIMPVNAQQIQDCGEPPVEHPTVPNGRYATAEQIRDARTAVLDYSGNVDKYLSCMDNRGAVLFTYMTDEQRTRFNNQLSELHEVRRKIQIQMNDAIRNFRKSESR